MMSASVGRLSCTTIVVGRNGILHSSISSAPASNKGTKKLLQHIQRVFYATRPVGGFRAAAPIRKRTVMEALKAPASDTPFVVGRAVALGGGLAGLGILCYYGLGLSDKPGTLEKSMMWPQYVRDRIHSTYAYLGGSLAITAASAVAVARNQRLMYMMTRQSWLALIGTFAAMIGTGVLCRSIEYTPGIGAKQMAWVLHAAVMGAVIAPLTLLGGPIMLRAALYTGGLVGGLSTAAVCAPSDRFLNMGGLLGMGLGAVVVASIGTWFLPPTTMLGAGLYSVALYGGLVVFGGFLLYDTQRVIRAAESHPMYGVRPYDPINAQMGIYLDALNIFIRIAMILAGGGNRRK